MLPRFTGLIGTADPRWGELLSTLEHDFYHLPSYVEFTARRAGGEAAAFVEHGPDFSLVLPLIFVATDVLGTSYCHATCPYGYPGIVANRGASPEALARAMGDLVQALRERRAVTAFARMHPLIQVPLAGLEGAGTLVAHGETVSMDLAVPLEASWSAIRSTHRRHINAAMKAGYTVQLGWEPIEEYLECYRQTMRRVSARDEYQFERNYVDGLRSAVCDHMHLCTVNRGGEVACAGLFSELGGIMQYHLGGTKDAFLSDSPMKLMFDFMRKWGHERKNRVLHLGGGLGGQANALFHFKAGFSDRRHTFYTYRIVADEELYARLCRDAGVGDARDGFFPAFARPLPGTRDQAIDSR